MDVKLTIGTLPGQVAGTATNDNALAGNIGEYISSTVTNGTAVPLTSGASADVTSISLTPGDWECYGRVSFVAGAGTIGTQFAGGISSTSLTLPNNAGSSFNLPITSPAGTGMIVPLSTTRFTLAVPTIIYLVALSVFSVSTMGGAGFIGARRVR